MQGWNEMSNAGDSILCSQHSWMLTRLEECWCESYILCGRNLVESSPTSLWWNIAWFMGIFINLDSMWPSYWLGRSNLLWNEVTKIVFIWPLATWSPKFLSANYKIISLSWTCFPNHGCLMLSFTTMWPFPHCLPSFMSFSGLSPHLYQVNLGWTWFPIGAHHYL